MSCMKFSLNISVTILLAFVSPSNNAASMIPQSKIAFRKCERRIGAWCFWMWHLSYHDYVSISVLRVMINWLDSCIACHHVQSRCCIHHQKARSWVVNHICNFISQGMNSLVFIQIKSNKVRSFTHIVVWF